MPAGNPAGMGGERDRGTDDPHETPALAPPSLSRAGRARGGSPRKVTPGTSGADSVRGRWNLVDLNGGHSGAFDGTVDGELAAEESLASSAVMYVPAPVKGDPGASCFRRVWDIVVFLMHGCRGGGSGPGFPSKCSTAWRTFAGEYAGGARPEVGTGPVQNADCFRTPTGF